MEDKSQKKGQLSTERKVTYYIGMGISVLGFLMFISTFFSVLNYSNNMDSMQSFVIESSGKNQITFSEDGTVIGGLVTGTQSQEPNFATAFVGILMIAGGQFVSRIGHSGLAGSGLVLNPAQARQDLKPFSQAKGQMLNDTLEEVEVVGQLLNKLSDQNVQPTQIIKIKCQHCKALNDEHSKFCDQCGQAM